MNDLSTNDKPYDVKSVFAIKAAFAGAAADRCIELNELGSSTLSMAVFSFTGRLLIAEDVDLQNITDQNLNEASEIAPVFAAYPKETITEARKIIKDISHGLKDFQL